MDKSSVVRKGSRVAGVGLVRHITNGLKKTERRYKRKKLYCGDASYCPRRATLFATTEGTSEWNAAGRFYMDTGTTVHEIIQESLMRQGIMIEAERRVDFTIGGVPIAGKIDGIIDVEGDIKILEIKTCGALPGAPKKEHLHQALTYALLSGIYKIVIFYMSRSIAGFGGKLTCTEFEYDVTSTDLDMIAEILATSVVGATREALPPIPLHIESQRDCGFCPFTKICWGGESIELRAFKKEDEDRIDEVKEALLELSRKEHEAYS